MNTLALTSKIPLISMLLLVLTGGSGSNALSRETEALPKLTSLSTACLETSRVSTCRRALSRSEVLQRQAAASGNYACQSHLLGLGADLLMASFNEGRDVSIKIMLKEVQIRCRDL